MVYIYVLKLEQDKYYIGKTNNPNLRLENHFSSNGCEWTKLYKPLKIIEIIPHCDNYDEDKYTKIYMDKYGIDNVRGGSYVQIELSKDIIKFLKLSSNSSNDRCFNCGLSGHFIKDCKKNKKYDDILELVSLNSLLYKSPYMIIKIFPILDLIKQLKTYRIKIGDIILNYYKTKYENIKEIIDDAIYIYDNYEEFVGKYNPHPNQSLDQLINYIPNQRIKFYKDFSKLLSSLPPEIYKELSENKKNFEEIELDIIKDYL
jgi:hypothetical protein